MSKDVKEAMMVLSEAIKKDPSYALSWHANLKMCFFDSLFPDDDDRDQLLNACEEGATNFMKLCFGVDTSSDMLDELKDSPKRILIERCSGGDKWYAGMVGQEVPLLGVEGTEYRSQEPGGFVNFISKKDGRII